jgi:2C-methyl-D-erythritol 2,4-cyclodiphosphate synthase
VDKSRVFVKAKTAEKLGAVGRGEAVRAWAVCLLAKTGG